MALGDEEGKTLVDMLADMQAELDVNTLTGRGEGKDNFNPLVNVKVYSLANTHDNTQEKHCKLPCPTQ